MDSMGCQMNTADAERMEGQLRSLGFARAEEGTPAQVKCSVSPLGSSRVMSGHLGCRVVLSGHLGPSLPSPRPQVVVLNTCSIREHAEAKVYSYLGPHAVLLPPRTLSLPAPSPHSAAAHPLAFSRLLSRLLSLSGAFSQR